MQAFWRWLYATGKARNTGILGTPCLRGKIALDQ